MTLHGPTLPKGTGGGAGGGIGVISLPGIEQILFVDKSSEVYSGDGTPQYPFNTIQAAITAAIALTPTTTNRILIFIYAGIYDEALTLADDYIYLQGVNRESTIVTNAAADTLTITTQETSVWNLTIEATGVNNVISISGAMTEYVEFVERVVQKAANDTSNILIGGGADIRFINCDLISGAGGATGNAISVTDTDAGNELHLISCRILGGYIRTHGGSITAEMCFGSAASAVGVFYFSSVNVQDVFIRDTRIIGLTPNSRKIFIAAAPSGDVTFMNNDLSGGANVPDLEAAISVTGYIIEGNVMEVGIAPEISHVAPTRYVGDAGDVDFYATLADAFSSCTFDDITIHMLKDETLAAQITPPSYNIYLEGHGFTISRAPTGIIFYLSTDDYLVTRDVILLGRIYLTGNGIYIQVGPKTDLTGQISIGPSDAATIVDINRATINGVTTFQPITIADADPTILVRRSYMKGATGQPAIYWNGVTNDNVKIKYSTIEHGSLAGNNPFGRSAAQTPDFRSHHSCYNSDPEAGGTWTNLVAAGERFDSLDVLTDF